MERRGVRFDPKISLGHVLTTLVFLFATVAKYAFTAT
jgi:hypothetical protein